MSAEESRLKRLRRLFPHNTRSDEAASLGKLSPRASHVIGEEQKQNVSSMSANHRSNGLWGEGYDLFTASNTSLHLQDIAKLFRDEGFSHTCVTTSDCDSDVTASREWRLCKEVLEMAESKKSELERGVENPLVRQMRNAYEEIITWTHKFVTLGDVISQVDPLHIGLPWAGIRAFLIVRTRFPHPALVDSCGLYRSSLSMIRKHTLRSLPGLHISLS